jgi:type I restriction enzyme S subunit
MKQGWQTKTLDQIAVNLDSRRIPITKADRIGGEYPYYGASGIVDYVADYIFDEDTLLVSEDGANLLARATPIAFPASGKYWVNNHAHVLKFDNMTTQRFVELYLESISLDGYITGAAQPKLNQKALNSIPIPFPLLAEQQRIVGILDEAFAGIATAKANAEKNRQNARALFESHLQAVFKQGGEGWSECRLGNVFDIGSSKRIRETEWTSSGVPFYGGKEIVKLAKFGSTVSDAYISEEKYCDYASKYDMPRKGDILITARGTIGVGYIVKEGDKFYYKDGNIIYLREKVSTNPHFILYAFRSKPLIEQFEDLTGATVKHLSIEKAKELILMMPNFSIQNAVVEHLRSIENETQRLESIYQQKLAALDELKQALLHQAFSGEL